MVYHLSTETETHCPASRHWPRWLTCAALSSSPVTSDSRPSAPACRLITPNIPEAEVLLGRKVTSSSIEKDAQDLSALTGTSVLLKAGHLESDTLTDILYNAESSEVLRFSSPKIKTANTHGTGCTLSSAIAAGLARGKDLSEAISQAKAFVHKSIERATQHPLLPDQSPLLQFPT